MSSDAPLSLHKPPPLRPGDTVAVLAPASAPLDVSKLDAGVDYLRGLGYHVERGRRELRPHGYLSGTDEERLEELNRFLRRDDVRAIFCARGGYGTLRILPDVDYEAARRHPKLVVGYSDITALQCALLCRAGVPSLSGPMVAVEWAAMDAASETQFWQIARGTRVDALRGPAGEALGPMRSGAAEGVLVGGNLTMIARLIGTPYLPSLDGAILFLEEVGEQPYRLDGLFAQLRLSGILERLGGLVLGGFTEWEPDDDRPTLTPDEVFDAYLRDAPFPVATGLVYGHFPVKSAVPIGIRARLDVTDESAHLTLLDALVATT